MVLMPEYVADARNLRPRDIWLAGLELRRNPACGFGDNLDPALNAMSDSQSAPKSSGVFPRVAISMASIASRIA